MILASEVRLHFHHVGAARSAPGAREVHADSGDDRQCGHVRALRAIRSTPGLECRIRPQEKRFLALYGCIIPNKMDSMYLQKNDSGRIKNPLT